MVHMVVQSQLQRQAVLFGLRVMGSAMGFVAMSVLLVHPDLTWEGGVEHLT